MTLISERTTIMPQVSPLAGVSSQYPSQVLSPPLMTDNSLTLPAAGSTWVPQAHKMVVGNEGRGATGGTPLRITFHSSSTSSGTSIDLIQEMLDEESRGKLKEKMR